MRSGLLAVGLVAGLASAAHADVDIEKGDAAFAEAQKLKDKGELDEACAKFRDSLSYNPNAVGTLLNVAICDQQHGRIGSALKRFTEVRDRAKEASLTEFVKLAEQHISEISNEVPSLKVALAERTDDTKLVVNDEVVLVKPDGTATIPVDPGSVTVIVSRPGHIPFEQKLDVQKGQHPEVNVGKLRLPVTNNGRRRIGQILTIGGVGLAATGLGLGLWAWHSYKDNVKHCGAEQPDGYHCQDPYYSDSNTAVTVGSVGSYVGGAGLVVAGIGAYLWFFGPHDERLAFVPQLDPEHAGIVAFGRF
jgi:hypothetical protein